MAAWQDVIRGADGVFSVASPFPATVPKDETDLIRPAKRGTLDILEAARREGIGRVVVTSSTGSAMYGVRGRGTFDERDWTDVTDLTDTTAYFRSKTIAERAAWDFVAEYADAPQLATVLPGLILGPVLEEDTGTSVAAVQKLLAGEVPAIPKLGFSTVDVRDVADLHIRAMTQAAAAGERFLGTAGFLWMGEVVALLKRAYPQRKFPGVHLPDFLVRALSLVDPTLKPVLVDLGAERRASAEKARRLLDWQTRSLSDTVLDTAASLFQVGIVT